MSVNTSGQANSNTGYLTTGNSLVALNLPVSPAVGDTLSVSGVGAGGWKLTQNAG